MSGFRIKSKSLASEVVHHDVNTKVRDIHEKIGCKIECLQKQLEEQKTLYTFEDAEYTFENSSIGCITFTACGGGSAGKHSISNNGLIISGKGGNSSQSCVKRPCIVINPSRETLTIKITVGKGGTYEDEGTGNGGDTSILVIVGTKVIWKHTLRGGNVNDVCSVDETDIFCGSIGEKGSTTLMNVQGKKKFGGNGAASIFSSGGVGGMNKKKGNVNDDELDNSENCDGLCGEMGSGGGGAVSIDGREGNPGTGGSGFVCIEF